MTEVGDSVEKAAQIIKAGGVVAFPTETSYGLGASIYIEGALKDIYEIKKRPVEKPLLVLIAKIESLKEVAQEVTKEILELAERFWPGPLTILVKAKNGLDQRLKNPKGLVAVRFTSHPLAQALIKRCGVPITGTSANLSGAPPARNPEEVLKGLRSQRLSYVLDGGELPKSPPSTILDPTTRPFRVLREGVIRREDIPGAH